MIKEKKRPCRLCKAGLEIDDSLHDPERKSPCCQADIVMFEAEEWGKIIDLRVCRKCHNELN